MQWPLQFSFSTCTGKQPLSVSGVGCFRELIPSRHPTNTVKALREMYNISSSRNLLGGQTNAGQIQQIAAEAQLVLKL